MDFKSPHALHRLIGDLQAFCGEVKHSCHDPRLVQHAEHQAQVLEALKSNVFDFFVNEGVDERLIRSPENEIFRQSQRGDAFVGSRPIFILGNRRSGTTLIAYLLNVARNICALPETFLASQLAANDALISLGDKVTRLDEPLPMYLRRLGMLADSIYQAFANRHKKSRWASKELDAPHRLDLLDAMFDYHAQFVYIVRHGFNVAYSCSSRFPGRDGTPLSSVSSLNLDIYLNEWISHSEMAMDFYERNSQRCCFVRYEDLTSEPEQVGARVFDFLGEQWEDDTLDRMAKQELVGIMGDNKILQRGARIERSGDAWIRWPTGLVRTLARKANPTLQRLGYDPVGAGG